MNIVSSILFIDERFIFRLFLDYQLHLYPTNQHRKKKTSKLPCLNQEKIWRQNIVGSPRNYVEQ